MKTVCVLAVCWYAQDLAQIMMTQTFLAPELFAVALLACATRARDPDSPWKWLAAAVIGGMLTDLRWLGVPGLSAALYVLALLILRRFWYEMPTDSRHMAPHVVSIALLCMAMTPVRLIFWDSNVTSGRVLTILCAQWVLTAVAVLAAALTRPYIYDEESF